MAVRKVDLESFLERAKECPVLDARSPGEFAHAHFPGAVSVPLFTDDERKMVGTAYKQKSREEAIKIGLEYFGVKMRRMVEEVESLVTSWPRTGIHHVAEEPLASMTSWGDDEQKSSPLVTDAPAATSQRPSILVHCWRGGMRSAAVAWLLDLYGFNVYLLDGGYKKFRQYVLETFQLPFTCNILGGFTGSAKTSILNELAERGLAVVNLEGLANHKGSAFGNVGPQPSQEMFENELAVKLRACRTFNLPGRAENRIWIEDESQRIGTVIIPAGFWEQMRKSPTYFLNIPFDERLQNIVAGYGHTPKQELIDAILRIQKRLGGLETKNAIHFLTDNNIKESFRILLTYYDKSYLKSFITRPVIENHHTDIICDTADVKENALRLLKAVDSKELSY